MTNVGQVAEKVDFGEAFGPVAEMIDFGEVVGPAVDVSEATATQGNNKCFFCCIGKIGGSVYFLFLFLLLQLQLFLPLNELVNIGFGFL